MASHVLGFWKRQICCHCQMNLFPYSSCFKNIFAVPYALQPYSKEPKGPPEEAGAPSVEGDDAAGMIEDGKRRGRGRNTNWCHNCSAMERDMGCLCCGERHGLPVLRRETWAACAAEKALLL